MNKKILSLMLVPVLLAGCSVTGEGDSGSSGQGGGSITHIEQDEYDSWANSWSKPGHLYFHYNRGEKMGYEN